LQVEDLRPRTAAGAASSRSQAGRERRPESNQRSRAVARERKRQRGLLGLRVTA
jgi:hypothetical protein